MAIRIQCNCGRKLKAPDNRGGQVGQCPACGAVMTLPLVTITAETSTKICPSCGETVSILAVLCTSCGFNMKTGDKLGVDGPVAGRAGAAGPGSTTAGGSRTATRKYALVAGAAVLVVVAIAAGFALRGRAGEKKNQAQREASVALEAASAPIDGALRDGHFANGLESWSLDLPVEDPAETDVKVVPGDSGRAHVLSVHRFQSGQKEGFARAKQGLNLDVSGYTAVYLRAAVKIAACPPAPAGASLTDKFPLAFFVTYESADAKMRTWRWTFLPTNDPRQKECDKTVPLGQWQIVTSDNLMALKPPPLRLQGIRVGGDGYDFESMVDELEFMGAR